MDALLETPWAQWMSTAGDDDGEEEDDVLPLPMLFFF